MSRLIKAGIVCALAGLVGSLFGIIHSPGPLDLTSRQMEYMIRETCDSIFLTFGNNYDDSFPNELLVDRPFTRKTISYPFPTEWPPTCNTGVWVAYSPLEFKTIKRPVFIHSIANRKPSDDTAKYVNGEGIDEYGEIFGGMFNMHWYHPLPAEPLERFPFFHVRFSPAGISGYTMEVDTLSGDFSDWLLETEDLRNHPGQTDLFRAIKECRLPTPEEKIRIRDFYLANLIEYKYQDFKILRPGQREFLDWLITE